MTHQMHTVHHIYSAPSTCACWCSLIGSVMLCRLVSKLCKVAGISMRVRLHIMMKACCAGSPEPGLAAVSNFLSGPMLLFGRLSTWFLLHVALLYSGSNSDVPCSSCRTSLHCKHALLWRCRTAAACVL